MRDGFTRESDRVYVTTPAGLVSMRFDGTDRRTHVKVVGKTMFAPESQATADAIVLRPDGRWALALVSNQLYILALPQVGGEAPTVDVYAAAVPLRKLTDVGADYATWADDGNTIVWALGSSAFRLPFTKVEFEPAKPDGEDRAEKPPAGDKDEARPPVPKVPKAEEIEIGRAHV